MHKLGHKYNLTLGTCFPNIRAQLEEQPAHSPPRFCTLATTPSRRGGSPTPALCPLVGEGSHRPGESVEDGVVNSRLVGHGVELVGLVQVGVGVEEPGRGGAA